LLKTKFLITAALLSAVLPIGSVGAAAAGPQAAPHRPHVDRAVREAAARHPGSRVPVLIQRKNDRRGTQAVQAHGGQVKRDLKTAHLVAAEVPANRLDELASDPDVVRIAYDAPMQSQTNGGGNSSSYNGTPLNDSRLLSAYQSVAAAPTLWGYKVRGTGVGVAVLDSGIKDDRPDFLGTLFGKNNGETPSTLGRVVKKVAISLSSQGSPIDDNGHGTWVAGIIAGRGWGDSIIGSDDNQYVGVAPDANLINLKISDRYGMAQTSDVIAGLEWVVENKDLYNIRVANISLLSSIAESYTTSYLDAAVELAWLKGITVVVSAGNAGPDTMRFAPANDPYVIVVGATDDNGTRDTADDRLAWFSSYGTTQDGFSKPDIVAPGLHIVSTLSSKLAPLAQEFPTRVVSPYYIQLSGTSGAAPVVSGLAANLVQVARQLNVSLSPDQIKWLLTHTAHPLSGAGTGAGYVNGWDASLFAYYNPTSIARANELLKPNNYLMTAYGTASGAVAWDNVSWENVSWENVSWENVSWENVSWENVSWENVSWENVAGD
jgi:serine protease AprX